VGDELAQSPSGFYSTQLRKANIQHDQIRFELFRFLNGIQSVARLPDDLKPDVSFQL
jgi:hypothetical protein